MKTSCISHIEKEPICIIRKSYVEICRGNVVAAALLSFFEYWHNVKLAIQEKNRATNDVCQMHGDPRSQDEGLYQFHNNQELIDGILGVGKKVSIYKSIKELSDLKLISVHKNPNPRYKFDKTNYFSFNDKLLKNMLDKKKESAKYDSSKMDYREDENSLPSTENDLPSPNNVPPSTENRPAITETTTKITSKITTKNKNTYPPEFENAWSFYPKRSIKDNQLTAYQNWKKRINEGIDHEDLLRATQNYQIVMEIKGNIGTDFVMQGKRFYGANKEYEQYLDIKPEEIRNEQRNYSETAREHATKISKGFAKVFAEAREAIRNNGSGMGE